MMHWAAKYIGMPTLEGGRTSDGVDCWGLLCLVYRQEFQIELPLLPGVGARSQSTIQKEMESWVEVTRPFDGAGVGMSQRDGMIHHVGVWVSAAGGRVLHCWDTLDVIADSLRGLQMRGVLIVKFYRHKQWPTS